MVKLSSRSVPLNKRSPAMDSVTADAYLAEVVAVSPVQEFVVQVTFSDGTTRIIDLEPYLRGPVFEPLRTDRELFRRVQVQAGTLGWENGADIDPDTLYYQGNPPWADEVVTRKKSRAEPRRKPTLQRKTKV